MAGRGRPLSELTGGPTFKFHGSGRFLRGKPREGAYVVRIAWILLSATAMIGWTIAIGYGVFYAAQWLFS
ncbi:hypothetical protein UP10_14460 [Bradyrhizobium sp. LTSPM299]|nr:hypothetical protein UP10_14460 [Bradyrhizobium sp. LTSPM299]